MEIYSEKKLFKFLNSIQINLDKNLPEKLANTPQIFRTQNSPYKSAKSRQNRASAYIENCSRGIPGKYQFSGGEKLSSVYLKYSRPSNSRIVKKLSINSSRIFHHFCT